ncbi:hypothetical protein F5Y17DRAFT_457394 [Xylariaceae sp. FL0594]|nr:hypothetical protein F5Y17DRAFT_457394 [Xylariaceae sp. FL0594]
MASPEAPMSSKAMISAALVKAQTAVQLDRAEYHSGARKYYVEAVELLDRVIARNCSERDLRKLKDIQQRYRRRIDQLDMPSAEA